MSDQNFRTTFSSNDEKSSAKPATNAYFTTPFVNKFGEKEVTTPIIYTADRFNPGPMKYRIYSPEGKSKVVERAEYINLLASGKWFDSEGDAKQASYAAKFSINELGEVIEKKKSKASKTAVKAVEKNTESDEE